MLENLEPRERVLPCRVRTVLAQLETKDQAILKEALTNQRWTPWTLSLALADRGITLTDKAIKKHQANQCSCAKLGE